MPHQQNTGGFFIVAIHKTAVLPWMSQNPTSTSGEECKSEQSATGNQCNTTETGDHGGLRKEGEKHETGKKEDKQGTGEKGEGDRIKQETGETPNTETNVNGKRQGGELEE